MADLKKLEEDAVSFAQQAISLDQQGLHDMAFFYYCVSNGRRCIFFVAHTYSTDYKMIDCLHQQHL